MRAGGCTVHQGLTPEAATVVKQSINLARRRGHAQVTPLHVANTMLSSSTGLLRAACLRCHSHPLQCKALELCFNVALNRMPASTLSAPVLGLPQAHHPPSLSNALVAAFKRAQAHQRRGCIDTQQQPLLAVKIELEQLIISILDDPSVSRVMREAGFSSTQVKSNMEQAVSMDICASTPPNRSPSKPKDASGPFTIPRAITTKPLVQVKNEDVVSVVETLATRRKRSLVIVGECLATTEAVVGGVMDRVNKGEVPEVLRNVQFIPLPLFSFIHMPLQEVNQKVGELRCLVKSCGAERGAILYLKDLNWAAEYRASGEKGRNIYCPLEHAILEIRNMFCEGENSGGRLWLMGSATYQTYIRCRVGNPSLETLWGLRPHTVPTGSLGLSLNCDSDLSQMPIKISGGSQFLTKTEHEIGSHPSCCADSAINFETDARSANRTCYGRYASISSSLPSWLRRYKEEKRGAISDDQIYLQGSLQLKDVCRKCNSISTSARKTHNHPSEITFNFSSVSPSSSSISSYDHGCPSLHPHQHQQQACLQSLEAKHQRSEQNLWISEVADECPEHKSRSSGPEHAGQTRSNPNSATTSGTMEMEYVSRFKELTAENLKTICDALERRVTRKKDLIPEIASTILRCRSGLITRKEKSSSSSEKKEDTWLFFQGGDTEGKERIARELAGIVFASYANFITIGLGNFSSTPSDSTDDVRNKRSREQVRNSYLESLFEAIRENPHRVIVMEDIEQADYHARSGIKTSMERGKIQSSSGEEVRLCDAIIILSCESFDSRSRACSPPVKHKADTEDEKEEACRLDLNLCAEDEEDLHDHFSDDMGLLESVDGAFFFELPEEL
ncbi:protein SMAX1-LIKE 3-like isoform X1 [Musa acuminata AAA Group]|uniref:protein SMAX1-LIKE 3-like isoform X1 n=1 Tax=Musa acuminata AAA Group TaxID=214697 RepID=UPI0031E10880